MLPSDASVNMPLSIESSAKERSNQPSSERHDATEYRAACQVFSDSVPHTEANVEGDECAAEAKADEGAADSEGVVDADAKGNCATDAITPRRKPTAQPTPMPKAHSMSWRTEHAEADESAADDVAVWPTGA